MPFSAWFAITLSVRRFELWMIGTCTLLAVCIPFIHDLDLLLAMRFLQGIASGTMIPVLMMASLKFLPPHIRLPGLALYALTATFALNLSIRSEEHTSDIPSLMRTSYAVYSLKTQKHLHHFLSHLH